MINITTQDGCTWTATRNNTWLTLTSPATGVGSGVLTFTASHNFGVARTGSITIAGQTQTTALVGDEMIINEDADPTAAVVSVWGRLLTFDGRGVHGAVITITSSAGETRMARSSGFGYYRFDDIFVGDTYLISPSSKRYQFTPRTIDVLDELTEIDFVAAP